jgi:nanoRNase/pAp phosphatase (c-di-AMP/oligoRNAs hydrolase)
MQGVAWLHVYGKAGFIICHPVRTCFVGALFQRSWQERLTPLLCVSWPVNEYSSFIIPNKSVWLIYAGMNRHLLRCFFISIPVRRLMQKKLIMNEDIIRTEKRSREKLDRLIGLLCGKGSLLIILQDYPDPDAIASAVGLRALANTIGGLQCSLAHGGTVGRSENRALADYLKLNLRAVDTVDAARFDLIAMVDAQPKTGNASLPGKGLPHIVIDHHPIRKITRSCLFTDVRGQYGATSTILFEYLTLAGIEIKVDLATALVYGIRSDTQDLGRETSKADIAAYLALYPLANKRMLSRIMNASLPNSYFQLFANALVSAQVFGSAVVACVGETENPDMIGEVADLLIRKEGADRVMCYGFHGLRVLFSIRLSGCEMKAGEVAQRVAGRQGAAGGHRAYAGGQIPLAASDSLAKQVEIGFAITERFRRAVGVHHLPGQKLVLS